MYFNLNQFELDRLSELKNSEILATGGTGFFGRWILEFVLYLNNKYNFNIKLYLLARNDNIEINEIAKQSRNIFFIKNDIRNIKELPENINYVIHAACTPDNIWHINNPIETMNIISIGTKQLLDGIIKLENVKKVINLSSGQIYGNSAYKKIKENSFGALDCFSVKSIYSESKRYSEALCKAYETFYRLPIVQVRPFSFIGPFMSLQKPWAINNFIHDAIKFKKIKIVGNGKPIRSYMYPTDMIEWLFGILVSQNHNNTYNLGSDEGVSLENLALVIRDILGNRIDIEILNMNDNDDVFLPDIEFAKKELDVDTKVNFKEALKKTIKWNIDK
ncbi:NAD-dependent epimerase/dehydratase family protein [Campylobacter sp. 7477a]|uniref:NAD-dependent epimerase/dehydratase family protein n=1 Tax=Campylobacter sp. 7477a TaxID=2735741 RepID=UPI003014CD67|nr:NAD-dependent epimerase/dehydratase family protein [Campylobacter sp. 7477a]